MYSWYGDVIITERRRVRVDYSTVRKHDMTPKRMRQILERMEYNDITDEESLELLEVQELDGEWNEE